MHLQSQFARWRNDQSERRTSGTKMFCLSQKCGGNSQTEGHCLARTRLCRDEQIAGLGGFIEDCELNRCRLMIVTRSQRAREARNCCRKGQEKTLSRSRRDA